MTVIGFDTETWLIEPGLLAPPLVCLQWQVAGGPAQLVHRNFALPVIEDWLASDALLVGHNVAYDMGVIAAQWPHLVPAIFAKYDRDEITDTLLREQLLMIARGTFRSYLDAQGEPQAVKYSLADCVRRHFGEALKKEGWRLFYRVFDTEPDTSRWTEIAREFQRWCRTEGFPQWALDLTTEKDRAALLAATPEEAAEYALKDAAVDLALYESQERYANLLKDQFRQARAAFALHLSSCWGMYTDAQAVDTLEAALTQEFDALRFELQNAGLIRQDGTADTKAAQAAMVAACAEETLPVYTTPKGAVSLSAESCGRFTDEDGEPLPDVGDAAQTIGQYSRFLTLRKTLSNDIKMLRAGTDVPVQPRYDMADTGRTRCSKPNIQAINRGAGIREAFRPRPGTVFIQADFEGLELHTLAAWCLEKIGWSKLAETLNAGRDAHAAMAADMIGITYEEAIRLKKAGDKDFKEHRQRAKAINFGYPGGLGAKKLVRYAKAQYGATLTEAEAVAAKSAWLRKFPEMIDHFRLAAAATNNPAGVGDEEHIFTGRLRGNQRYSAMCNGRFQGLGADAAKEALWRVTRACYAEPASPLFGCRVVAFVHDEIIAECEEAKASRAAIELGRLMIEGANKYLGRVPVRIEPQIMRLWSKSAEPTYDASGALIPWEAPAAPA